MVKIRSSSFKFPKVVFSGFFSSFCGGAAAENDRVAIGKPTKK